MTDGPYASFQRQGDIGRLVLQRPGVRNALSIELLEALHALMGEVESTPPRVLVVTGEGKAFCAGMDLRQVLSAPEAPHRLLSLLARLTHRLRMLPSITLAQVNGAAIGGGCGLACVCDFALTHADSIMGFPEVDLGVCPAVVAPWLVRKVGPGPARRILLGGGTFSGQRALELGLVSEALSSRDELGPRVDAVAARIASGGPHALAATKGLLNELDGSTDLEVLLRAAELSARVIATPEARATLRARLKS
ncbi:MAG: enoyl-CoA hydratase/isomerase family protein [Phycisphaerales bacterium]|nr:enoyl-CoA hydratase/isomerase family protein [Phycisphaerales bacterium]